MKNFKFLIACIVMLTGATIAKASDDTTYSVPMTEDWEPEYVDKHPGRNRMPARPTICTISLNGINIPNVSSQDIYFFEIYDSQENILGTYSTEQDFISFIYGITGTVEIRFHLDGYVLHGYLNL